MVNALFDIAQYLLSILSIIVIVQVIMSLLISFNVINIHQPFIRSVYEVLERLTEPLYRPIRRILPDLGMIDFSPWVLLILIRIVMMLLDGLRYDLTVP
ncbi:MAG TPA: YggT family protein [Sphingomicrobium sp.]|jgi:YggT family protein|nr:YggT family protein [Sphingomicrobium sp.]